MRPNNVHIPQDISKKGAFAHSFALNGDHRNTIDIGFSKAHKSFEEMGALVGYGGLCPPTYRACGKGIALPIEWAIVDSDGKLIASGKRTTVDAQGWAQNTVYRRIGDFKAPPGRYTLKAVLPQDTPEFSSISTELLISGPVK